MSETIMPRSGTVRGIVAGDARVAAGSDIEITGIVSGNLVVERGAHVRISGIVDGRVEDLGGSVVITGMVG